MLILIKIVFYLLSIRTVDFDLVKFNVTIESHHFNIYVSCMTNMRVGLGGICKNNSLRIDAQTKNLKMNGKDIVIS